MCAYGGVVRVDWGSVGSDLPGVEDRISLTKDQRLQLLHPELVKELPLQRLESVSTLAVNNRNFDSNKRFVEAPKPRADAKIPFRAALLFCVVWKAIGCARS